MKKALLAILLTAGITLGLTACGGGNDTPALTPTPAPAPAPAATPVPGPPPAADVEEFVPTGVPIPGFDPDNRSVVEIEFWHAMTGAHQDGIDEIIAAFHAQNPYVRVTNIFQGNYGALRNQIMLNDLAGNLPHLGQATVSDTTLYMVDGMILPLNQFMDDPVVGVSQEHMDDIIRGFRATSVFDGVWYSIPFSKSVRVLYYNREMFNAAGLNPPTTWEELFNAAEILTEANPGITGFHFEGGSFDMEWVAMLFQQGGTYIDEASNRAVFASPQGASAMEFIINLVNSPFGGFPPAGTFNSGIFGQADIAMYIGSSAGLPHVTNAVAGTFDWGTAPIPGGAVEFAGNDLIMFENTSHSIEERVAAWELMRFTTEAETSARWAMASGYVPVTYTAAASQLFQDFLRDNPRAAAATASLDDGFFRTRNLQGGQVRTYLLEQFEEIRFGNISIEDGLERAQANANAALERGR